MNKYVIVTVALIIVGILGLTFGQFSYIKETQSTNLDSHEITVNEKQTVNNPVWVGGRSIVVGAGMSFFALVIGLRIAVPHLERNYS